MHNGIKEKGIEPVKAEEDFPEIYRHLMRYERELEKRLDKGAHWSNLRNCAYIEDFDKEKIIWLELTDKPNFALDKDGFYINNTVYFMVGDHLKYILGFLNSRLCEWYFDKIAATSGVGTRRWIKMYIDQICIPLPVTPVTEDITLLVDNILKGDSQTVAKNLIDVHIYDLFELSLNERQLIINADL